MVTRNFGNRDDFEQIRRADPVPARRAEILGSDVHAPRRERATPSDMLALQRLAGNAAVCAMLAGRSPGARRPAAPLQPRGKAVPVTARVVAAVQRALATNIADGSPGNDLTQALGNNPQAHARFQHGEVLTNEWGAFSNTGAFTNDQGSDIVDGDKNLHWGNTKLGVLKPLVSFQPNGRRDTHVKMHLVNSFLHPQANTWADNWVFGPHDLNAKHSQIEGAAIVWHPNIDHSKAALSYRTQVTGNDAQTLNEDQLAQEIHDKIDTLAKRAFGFEAQPLDIVKSKATVDGKSLATYANNWTAAIANNVVANKIQVEYRTYTLDGAGNVGQGGLTTTPAQTAEVSRVQAVLSGRNVDTIALLKNGIIVDSSSSSGSSSGSGSKRKGSSGGGGGPSKNAKKTKKTK